MQLLQRGPQRQPVRYHFAHIFIELYRCDNGPPKWRGRSGADPDVTLLLPEGRQTFRLHSALDLRCLFVAILDCLVRFVESRVAMTGVLNPKTPHEIVLSRFRLEKKSNVNIAQALSCHQHGDLYGAVLFLARALRLSTTVDSAPTPDFQRTTPDKTIGIKLDHTREWKLKMEVHNKSHTIDVRIQDRRFKINSEPNGVGRQELANLFSELVTAYDEEVKEESVRLTKEIIEENQKKLPRTDRPLPSSEEVARKKLARLKANRIPRLDIQVMKHAAFQHGSPPCTKKAPSLLESLLSKRDSKAKGKSEQKALGVIQENGSDANTDIVFIEPENEVAATAPSANATISSPESTGTESDHSPFDIYEDSFPQTDKPVVPSTSRLRPIFPSSPLPSPFSGILGRAGNIFSKTEKLMTIAKTQKVEREDVISKIRDVLRKIRRDRTGGIVKVVHKGKKRG